MKKTYKDFFEYISTNYSFLNDVTGSVIISANFGGYDFFNEPSHYDCNFNYFYFTDDSSLKSDIFNIIYIDTSLFNFNPKILAKIPKLLSHYLFPNAENYVWIDSNRQICEPFYSLLNENINYFTFFKHPRRSCIYDELEACYSWGKVSVNDYSNVLSLYTESNFKRNKGLICGAFFIRSNLYNNLFDKWWQYCDDLCFRDQLFFNYLCPDNLKINYIDDNINDNVYFTTKTHTHPIVNSDDLFSFFKSLKFVIFHYLLIFRNFLRTR